VRILNAIHSVNPAGGGPIEGVVQLGRAHLAAGRQVEVASLDSPSAEYVQAFPLPIHALGPGVGNYGYSRRWVSWMRANASRFDAVIVEGLWQFSSFGVWRALHDSTTPYFVFTHGMLDPWFNKAYPLKRLKKQLYWPWAESWALRDARAVFFTSEEERLQARKSFKPYVCNERVVGYGTSRPSGDPAAQRAAFHTAFPSLGGKRLVLYLSRIHPKKGCDLLLKAFASVADANPNLYLIMAGPDPTHWVAELKQLAAQLKISERVSWPGMLSGDLKWGAFHSAEAFILPSHQENFGVVVAESLACGKPALITDKVNIWREIQEDQAGLVRPDTLEGVTQLLHDWLALEPLERETMSRNAEQSFQRRFEISQVADRICEQIKATKKS